MKTALAWVVLEATMIGIAWYDVRHEPRDLKPPFHCEELNMTGTVGAWHLSYANCHLLSGEWCGDNGKPCQ